MHATARRKEYKYSSSPLWIAIKCVEPLTDERYNWHVSLTIGEERVEVACNEFNELSILGQIKKLHHDLFQVRKSERGNQLFLKTFRKTPSDVVFIVDMHIRVSQHR